MSKKKAFFQKKTSSWTISSARLVAYKIKKNLKPTKISCWPESDNPAPNGTPNSENMSKSNKTKIGADFFSVNQASHRQSAWQGYRAGRPEISAQTDVPSLSYARKSDIAN
jgi:hypothetical protein